jgi:hypothetical protein
MSTLNFNAHEVDPATAFEPIPTGKYIAVITESGMKPTKTGNGHFLELTLEVVEGEYKGRKVWARLNLDNPNQTAVKIAQSELSAICRSVNVMQPQDSVELHNLPMEITVKCRKREDTDEITNEIKGYAVKGNSVNPSAPAEQSQTNAAPWQR